MLVLLAVLVLPQTVFPQAPSEEALKVAYLYNFLKYVRWPNDQGISEFVIGLHGRDEGLATVLRHMLGEREVRDRRILVRDVDNLGDADGVHMLVLSPSLNSDIRRIAHDLHGRPILLVTDGCEQKQLTMINLERPQPGRITFEVNRPNLTYEGLEARSDLLLQGRGINLDVAMLYRQMEASLQESRDTIAGQEDRLVQQRAEAQRRTEELAAQRARLGNGPHEGARFLAGSES